MLEDFMVCISQSFLHLDKEDKWLWSDPPSYSFSVKSAYTKLANHDAGVHLNHFLCCGA